MQNHTKILQKLVFDVQLKPATPGHAPAQGCQFTFIYGTAPEGLSDFEMAISSLKVGDRYDLPVGKTNLGTYMGRLFPVFCKQTRLAEFSHLTHMEFVLRETSQASPAEIVSAMAEAQKYGGCSGSCDCGCH